MKSAYQNLLIVPINLMEQYKVEFNQSTQTKFHNLKENVLSIDTFSFYTSISAVYSSKIEGENIDLDSYIKHKRFGTKYQPDYTRKIDDLYDTYLFAQGNDLNKTSLANTHKLLTKHILQKSQQGKYRSGSMYVVTQEGKIEYIAADSMIVPSEMNKLLKDIEILLSIDLSFDEVFYFAAMLHLVFVKIHPFEDGNGRTARLLEKWFLSLKLGPKAWFIQSEKYYYQYHLTYYTNIRALGLEYDHLQYENALPFLKMLPNAITLNDTSE